MEQKKLAIAPRVFFSGRLLKGMLQCEGTHKSSDKDVDSDSQDCDRECGSEMMFMCEISLGWCEGIRSRDRGLCQV